MRKAVGVAASVLLATGPATAADTTFQSNLSGLVEHVPVAALFGGGDKLTTEYSNFHQLKALNNASNEINFQDLDGKVVLVVNVASK